MSKNLFWHVSMQNDFGMSKFDIGKTGRDCLILNLQSYKWHMAREEIF